MSLLGNHEEMILSARHSRKALEFWLNCGGVATLDSYCFGARLADIPERHWRFLERCRPFFETDTHLFVHANYLSDLPLTEQPGEVLRWRSLDDFLPGPHVSGKAAVLGHTPQTSGEVLNLGHLLCLDTFIQGGQLADGSGRGDVSGLAGGRAGPDAVRQAGCLNHKMGAAVRRLTWKRSTRCCVT